MENVRNDESRDLLETLTSKGIYLLDMTSLKPGAQAPLASCDDLKDYGGLDLTIREDQQAGKYCLIQDADEFSGGVQLCLNTGFCFGAVPLDGGICYGDSCYYLYREGNALILEIKPNELISAAEVTVENLDNIRISSGSAVNTAQVRSGGVLTINEGAVVSSAMVLNGGAMTVLEGGILLNTTVSKGASLRLVEGAQLGGTITVGGSVSTEGDILAYGTTFTFDLSQQPTDGDYLLDDLSKIQDATFKVLLGEKPLLGTYKLAGNAADFRGSISICMNTGVCFDALSIGGGFCSGDYCYSLEVDSDDILCLTITPNEGSSGETLLPYTVPEAEYMYGCVATAVGMLLGYYDKHGYMGYDVSNIIDGEISIYSRGTDGNSYDMDAFDTVLGNFIASEEYVQRFYKKTPSQELQYTFVDGDVSKGLNVSVFNCLADWLGTGQYWRGNDDLATQVSESSLAWSESNSSTYPVDGTAVPNRFMDFKYGLQQYLATKGYSLDAEATRTVRVDVKGGDFTFEDYMAEIDAGRPVLISINTKNGGGHMMLGYGYDKDSRRIIFDDTYANGRSMEWDGTCDYSGESYTLSTITTIILDTDGLAQKASNIVINEWGSDYASAKAYAKEHDLPIFIYYGNKDTCHPCKLLDEQVFESYEFFRYVHSGSMVLLKNPVGVPVSYSGIPSCFILDADGNVLAKKTGYGGDKAAWMDWFDDYVELKSSNSGVDLLFKAADGWSDSLIVTTAKGQLEAATNITDYDTIYLNLSLQNAGTKASGEFDVVVYVDGNKFRTITLRSISAGEFGSEYAISIGKLMVGQHKIDIYIDPTNILSDEDQANNVLTRTVTVNLGTAGREVISSATSSVQQGETLSNTFIAEGGIVDVQKGGTALSNTLINGGRMIASTGAQIGETIISSGGYMLVSSSALVSGTLLQSGGSLVVRSGTTLADTEITNGTIHEIINGNTFSGLAIDYQAKVYVYSGGSADDVKLFHSAVLYVSGGRATNLSATSLDSTLIRVSSSGVIDKITIAGGGVMMATCGGIAYNTVVSSGGVVDISSNGSASGMEITSHGSLYIINGLVRDLAICRTGWAYVKGNTTLSGDVVIGGEMYVWNQIDVSKARITFDLSERMTTDYAIVNDLACIANATFGITVSCVQAEGTYKLANGAADFSKSITICTDAGVCAEEAISVGQTASIGVYDYTLVRTNGVLSLTVKMVASRDKANPVLVTKKPAVAIDAYRAVFSWNPATDDSVVSTYEVLCGGITYQVGRDCSLTLKLQNGNYTAKYRAVDVAGKCSEWSDSVWFTIDSTDTKAPVITSVTVGTFQAGRADWNWDVTDNLAVEYYVLTVNGREYKVDGTATGYSLYVGGDVRWSLAAFDFKGNSAVSSGMVQVKIPDSACKFYLNSKLVSSASTVSGLVLKKGYSADYVTADSGGIVSSCVFSSGASVDVGAGGMMRDCMVNNGASVQVNFDGVARDAKIGSGGRMYLYSSSYANGINVSSQGYLYASDASVQELSIHSGGSAYLVGDTVLSGGILVGGLMTLSNKVDASKAKVTFDLSERKATDSVIVKQLANVADASFGITVSSSQAAGTYKLADGAADFSKSITICTDTGVCAEEAISVGQTASIGVYDYTLVKSAAILSLTVKLVASRDKEKPVLVTKLPAVAIDAYRATLSWNPATDDCGISHYEVLCNGVTYRTGRECTVALSLQNGDYTAKYRAVDAVGKVSAWSDCVDFTIDCADTIAPVITSVTVDASQTGRAAWSWTATDNLAVERYVLTINGREVALDGAATGYSMYVGGKVEWSLAAFDFNGNSAVSRGTAQVAIPSNACILSSGGKVVSSAQSMANLILKEQQCYLVASYGGVASKLTISSGARAQANYGGVLKDTVVSNGGAIWAVYNGVISGTTLMEGGEAYITGGIAYDTTIKEKSYVYVYGGGIASGVTVSATYLSVQSAGVAYDVDILGGYAVVLSNGLVSDVSVGNTALLYLSACGSAKDVTVLSGGVVHVMAAGENQPLTAISDLIVSSGGLANIRSNTLTEDMTIAYGGSATFSAGAKLQGDIVVGGKMTIVGQVDATDAKLVFDLTKRKTTDSCSIVNLDYAGDTTLAITVADNQAEGTYRLASGCSSFNKSITICTSDGVCYEPIAVGEKIAVKTHIYTVQKNTSDLVLTITARDLTPPTITGIKADISTPTNGFVTVTAVFKDNKGLVSKQYRIGENGQWNDYKNGVSVYENATVYFRAVDSDYNETLAQYIVSNIDKEPPVISLTGDTTSTLKSASITAVTESGLDIYYSQDNKTWKKYTGKLDVTANGKWYFKATDKAGNTGTNSITFANIDCVAPRLYDVSFSEPDEDALITMSFQYDSDVTQSFYSWNDGPWTLFTGKSLTFDQNGRVSFKLIDAVGNEAVGLNYDVTGFNIHLDSLIQSDIPNTTDALSLVWNKDGKKLWTRDYGLEVSINGHQLDLPQINGEGVELHGLGKATIDWSVKPDKSEISTDGPTISFDGVHEAEPQVVQALDNSLTEALLARKFNTWNGGYQACHVGSQGDWNGTNEIVSLDEKNQIADIFVGSQDTTLLYLTDDASGDALFVDNIYSELPGVLSEQQARIAQIDEIRAGAGDDIVDMTSQRFEYIGNGVTIYGGLGNDTIWANKGNNTLFGDAGDDRLVGASGNDILVGGIGNDSMHGGGGNDIFCFCDNWGQDTIEQLAEGDFRLWFTEGLTVGNLTLSADGNDTLIVKTGTENRITVKDISVAVVQSRLIFGKGTEYNGLTYSELSDAGAFSAFSSEKIFKNTSIAS